MTPRFQYPWLCQPMGLYLSAFCWQDKVIFSQKKKGGKSTGQISNHKLHYSQQFWIWSRQPKKYVHLKPWKNTWEVALAHIMELRKGGGEEIFLRLRSGGFVDKLQGSAFGVWELGKRQRHPNSGCCWVMWHWASLLKVWNPLRGVFACPSCGRPLDLHQTHI